jgi:hypothetical protein
MEDHMTMASQQGRRPLPPEDELNSEIEKMSAGLFTGDAECDVLCRRLNDLWDDLQQTTDDQQKRMILAEIKAIQTQRRILGCGTCFAQ